MMTEKDKFINLKLFNSEETDSIMSEKVIFMMIETIQVNINEKILEIENVRYIFNIMSNLLSFSCLEKQDFEMKLITRNQDDQKVFEIIDQFDQIFHELLTTTDVYKIAAVKSQKKIPTNADLNIDTKSNVNTELKLKVKKRSIYKILLT